MRSAALGRSNSPSGSLASSYFRKALLAEGRRLMRGGQDAESLEYLGEAVRLWDLYPDLHCLHGTALARSGELGEALQEARFALRLNPDYTEARLLLAVVLQALERSLEAADQMNALVEASRRVDHWLIQEFSALAPFKAESLPEDLMAKLVFSLSGQSEKEELAAAVRLCREGDWKKGKDVFADLVERRPRYPDYRTRLAASLFQLGQAEEGLEQVEAALALNENYRTAVDLKGLILADIGRLAEARQWLAQNDQTAEFNPKSGAHEELFGAYLRGVLALLNGHPKEVAELLAEWPDLVRSFARAELLLAAADDTRGRTATCGRRLADLADEWSAEEIYFDLLVCHHLENRRYRDAEGVLRRWPGEARGSDRHRFLEELLLVCEGRTDEGRIPTSPVSDQSVGQDAWTFLAARSAFQEHRDEEAWRLCLGLCEKGLATEKLLRLQTASTAGVPPEMLGSAQAWQPAGVLPDSCLAHLYYLDLRRGQPERAVSMVEEHLRLHPENLHMRWLLPEFWLGPVRAWLA